MVLHVAADAVLERRERPGVAGGAQPVHARLGEGLVLAAQLLRHVDELDPRGSAPAASQTAWARSR